MDEHLLTFPLTSESVVVEIGGYEGFWSEEIARRYDPHLYIFEPQAWAYGRCLKRLPVKPTIRIFNYGLWDSDKNRAPMVRFHTDGASFIINEEHGDFGDLREASRVFQVLDLFHIDLMQVNIEGGEYILLPHLLRLGWMERIDYLIVQFHMHAEFYDEERNLRNQINQTHDIIWADSHTIWKRKGMAPDSIVRGQA